MSSAVTFIKDFIAKNISCLVTNAFIREGAKPSFSYVYPMAMVIFFWPKGVMAQCPSRINTEVHNFSSATSKLEFDRLKMSVQY